MIKRIETPKISEILYEEFMEPYNLSAYKLAKEIDVPTSRIQDILHGKYFGISERYFINLQNDIDARNARIEMADSYAKISPLVFDSKPVF